MIPRNFDPLPPRIEPWRKYFLLAWLVALFLIIIIGGPLRVEIFSDKAQGEFALRHEYKNNILMHRGAIVDATGHLLAMSSDVYDVRADMIELIKNERWRQRHKKLIPEIADILNAPSHVLTKKFSGKGRAVLLKRSLSPARAYRLKELLAQNGLYGIRVDYDSKRYYPQKEYTASVVGYTNYQDQGQSGIEFVKHDQLQQKNGKVSGIRGRTGVRLDSTALLLPKDGADITLSIDTRTQFYAYEALHQAVAHHQAQAAAAAVLDLRTGNIMALASYPGFNSNNIDGEIDEKNHAISDAVEPGSLIKPFIVALALEKRLVNNSEMFPAHKPQIINGAKIKDEHIHEPVNITGVLRKSSNIGAAMLASRIGKAPIWDLYRRLGFGKKLLNMPSEAAGKLRKHKYWRKSDWMTHSYGYGFSTTLLRMVAAYSIFATDGYLISPRLEKSSLPPYRQRILKASTALRVRAMLETVTQPGGTATAAAINGYKIAGKTGTARKYLNGKYQAKSHRAFFVGMAPASAPRYIVAVMIDEPTQNGRSGGTAAAPVFRQIMSRVLRFNAIAPDALFGDV